MKLNQIQFGALLTYRPYGKYADATAEEARSVAVMWALKNDEPVTSKPIQMSEWVANEIHSRTDSLPFGRFFQPETVLVPIPKSNRMQPHELWVPSRIATSMNKVGIGKKVSPSLIRAVPIRKSATSPSYMGLITSFD